MNTNTGNDPMLSSFTNEDWGKLTASSTVVTDSSPSSLTTSLPLTTSFLISADGLLTMEHSEFTDLTTLWPTKRKRVLSVKMEDDDSYSSYSMAGDVDTVDIDIEDMDGVSDTAGPSSGSEVKNTDLNDLSKVGLDTADFKYEKSIFHMSEADARRYVEEQFEKIAVVPKSHLSQREKIEFILARSDCTEFALEDVLSFDKKCPDSARACAQIVQNIPQRYRWECVKPEDIPCCYTIVADCKKLSSRDKPPRPMNAFMIWAQSARRLINELCPKMQNALISEALGYFWRQKSDAFKQRFEQEKMKLRRFHGVEFPEYKYKPKTKVQKAREKQELSLTKAKMRASVKREKLLRTEESSIRRTSIRCGRPRKVKGDSVKPETNSLASSQHALSDTCQRKSPTKPAIKDMLTLKILNDRLCKDTSTAAPKTSELVINKFGQMSPPEVDSIGSCDVMEDLHNFDQDLRGKSISSSVFDTPANTPPADDDERHHSPLHTQQVSLPVAATQPPPPQVPGMTGNVSPALFTPLQPTVSSRTAGNPADTRNLSLLDLLSKRSTLTPSSQPHPVEASQVLDITELLFTYVAESLSAAQYGTDCSTSHQSTRSLLAKDTNNNIDMNNNSHGDINNNVHGLCTGVQKPPNFLYEPTDLDSVFLDLNVPILTDDDVRSILNTL